MMNWFPVFVAICCLALPLRGDPDSPSSTPPRWLLVVDASYSMNRLKPVIADILHESLLSGFANRMQPGDIFEIWAVHQEKTDFPFRVWTPEQNANIAASAKQWLQRERFQKKLRMDLLFQEIHDLLQTTETVSVLFFSDGTEFIQGTPFDHQINAIYREHNRNLRRAKVPFVVVLNAHQGKFISWVVHSGGGAIHFPSLPVTIVQTSLQADPAPDSLPESPTGLAEETISPDPSSAIAGDQAPPPDSPETIGHSDVESDAPQLALQLPELDLRIPHPDAMAETSPSSSVLPIESPELPATPESQPPILDHLASTETEQKETTETFAPEKSAPPIAQAAPPELASIEHQPPPILAPSAGVQRSQADLKIVTQNPGSSNVQSAPSPPAAPPALNRRPAIVIFALISLALAIGGLCLFSPRTQQPSLISKSIERKKSR
jgi:hypothetical protein